MYLQRWTRSVVLRTFEVWAPNLPRVFIALNHKSFQKPNTSPILAQFNPRKVLLPKSRGLRCSSAFNCAKRSSVKIICTVFGHREPISHAATPCSLMVLMESCTVWASQTAAKIELYVQNPGGNSEVFAKLWAINRYINCVYDVLITTPDILLWYNHH